MLCCRGQAYCISLLCRCAYVPLRILRESVHYREKAKGPGQRRIALSNASSESSTESDLLSALKDHATFPPTCYSTGIGDIPALPDEPAKVSIEACPASCGRTRSRGAVPNTRASIQHTQNIEERQNDAASNKAMRALRNAASVQVKRKLPLLRMKLLN